MTDNVTNTPHHYTLFVGRLLLEHVTNLKALADELLAPGVADVIQKTDQPFIKQSPTSYLYKRHSLEGKYYWQVMRLRL